jgi:hypothetical protein
VANYKQEKNEKDEEYDAVEDERHDKGRDGADGALRSVGYGRVSKHAILITSSNTEELGLKEGREISSYVLVVPDGAFVAQAIHFVRGRYTCQSHVRIPVVSPSNCGNCWTIVNSSIKIGKSITMAKWNYSIH